MEVMRNRYLCLVFNLRKRYSGSHHDVLRYTRVSEVAFIRSRTYPWITSFLDLNGFSFLANAFSASTFFFYSVSPVDYIDFQRLSQLCVYRINSPWSRWILLRFCWSQHANTLLRIPALMFLKDTSPSSSVTRFSGWGVIIILPSLNELKIFLSLVSKRIL